MRITASLDEDHARKLEQLKRQNRLNTTQVIKQAIDLLYEQTKPSPEVKLKALLESDFIGCAEGSVDLSENYKQYLTEALPEKHGSD
jgi:hypothetical protein